MLPLQTTILWNFEKIISAQQKQAPRLIKLGKSKERLQRYVDSGYINKIDVSLQGHHIMKINQIIDKIDDDQLFIPAFQREYVWKKADVKALFASLIKGYPTGTLLTWETSKPPELKGSKKYNKNMGAVKLVLDGQQRITTIYMILEGKIPPYYTQRDIKNNVFGLHVNVETLELEYFKKNTMENNPLWVNLTDIFQNKIKYPEIRRILNENSDLNSELENLIYENFETVRLIKERDFKEDHIPITADIKEAIDIFYIVNASGVNLTDAELALAQICGYWPEARELFKAKLSKLSEQGFVFKLDFIIYVLLAVTHNMGSEMKRLHNSDNEVKIREAWKALDEQVLDYVMNILKTHAYIDHTDEVNSVFAIIPIISFVFSKNSKKLSELEIKKIIKWFYFSQLRQRYVSQTPQKLDKDIGIVNSSSKPFDELLGLIGQERPLAISKEEFVGRGIKHPLFNLMKWYFKSKNAVCLGTGVAIRNNMGKKYTLEKDHIFPYAALKANGYAVENRFKYALAHEITNRAFLTQVENRGKSDTAAKTYLTNVNEKFPTSLEKQCIPTNPSLWEFSNFEQFLEERRTLLAGELNSFLSNITIMNTDLGKLSLEELISEDEHGELEFKSSLRWCTNQNKIDKSLEKNILKTIAAFNNGYNKGGKLIIGVDDNKNVLGLNNDYSTLKSNDKDSFERHLNGLIANEWGIEFATRNVNIAFEIVSGLEVCIVDVTEGEIEQFLNVKDKNGQTKEVFYIRSGNASEIIENPSKISTYIKNRFY